jgi:glycosyltransferase involved in cell wall biosynthesis
MTSKQLSLSIVTPSFNQGMFIEETIRSIMDQHYPDLEHIVMDGGSTDNTIEILSKYPHVTWKSEQDRGQTHAVNKGLQLARGDIIGWLNSDDTYLPGAFEAVRSAFEQSADCAVVFGNYHATDESGAILYSKEGFCGGYEEMIRWWDYTYAIHQPTVFVRREVIASAGNLDESYHYAMDYEWWLRVAARYRFHHIPRYLATYRMHKDAKTFSPLEENVYPEQLRASKEHWGPWWTPSYWNYRRSYQAWLLRKQHSTLHDPVLETWHRKG